MKLLLLAASSALSLLLIETALRVTGRFSLPPVGLTAAVADLYEVYPPYGYRLRPSRTATYDYPLEQPRQLTVHSNAAGFRSAREFDEPGLRPRILVLGDSMVFGQGVEESERFTEQLEANRPAWRVDNMGMTGFGPDLMLRALEQVGLKSKPDAVVVGIYTDDFRRVRPEYAGVGFEIPRFVLRSGELASIDYPRATAWSRLSTVAAIRQLVWRQTGAEWALNAAVLDRMREHASKAPFALVLMFLPGTSDTRDDQERRAWLRAYAARTGLAFIDLTDPLLRDNAHPVFIPENWHLNPDGHQIVAHALLPVLDGVVE